MSSPAPLRLEEAVAQLSTLLGREFVRLDGVMIGVEPETVEEVAAILRFSNANGMSVTPAGGGTKSAWGNPVATDIVLSLRRLNKLREHAWQDMTCTVEAGCTWSDMQSALGEHRQMVAVDVLWPECASVGGIVATNDGATLRLRYGGLRDLIIGMTIVLADGTIAKSGGKVVKNVAGYDLHKLMIGGFGTLGVIAEVNFRLHPIEAHIRSWSVVAENPALFSKPLAAMLDSQLVLRSVQIRSLEQGFALDVCIAGLPETMKDSEDQMRQMFGKLTAFESDGKVWLERQRLVDRRGDLILKLSVLPSVICSTIASAAECGAELGGHISIVAQATGLITVALSAPPELAITIVDRLRDRIRGSCGSVTALRIPELLRGRVQVWDPLPGSIGLMREIKSRFDSKRTLNPGRFLGGI